MSNMFGGKNENSLYVPMSETEQEVLERIKDLDLELRIVGWGLIANPRIRFGDLRIQIPINITFDRPEIHIPIYSLILELGVKEGVLLFKKEYPTLVGGEPIMVGSGFNLNMVWDIAIKEIDKDLIKRIKPKHVGLTNRLDNWKLDSTGQQIYQTLREQEKVLDEMAKEDLAKAKKKASVILVG